MNVSDYFRMIFTYGLSSREVNVFVDLSKDEQAPIKEKIVELTQAIKDNKSYEDWRGPQTQAVLGNDDFEDLIIWREPAMFLGMTSYIKEINRSCLEIALNNCDDRQKLKQFCELFTRHNFQPEDFKKIYNHILFDWHEISMLLGLNECYRSDSIKFMLTFLKQNAKQNSSQTKTVILDEDEKNFKAQISNLVQYYPHLKTLIVKTYDLDYSDRKTGNHPLFNTKKTLGLENLEIKRLMVDFLFEEFYYPDELYSKFPHLEELYFVSSSFYKSHSHFTNIIIEEDCFKNFVKLNKIVIYESEEFDYIYEIADIADDEKPQNNEYDNTTQVYLRSNDTHKFIGFVPDEESASSDSDN